MLSFYMKRIIFLIISLHLFLQASVLKDLKLNSEDITSIKTSKEKKYIYYRLQKYIDLKKSLENEKDILKILNRVNLFYNSFKSQKDFALYSKKDHWATPKEFMINGQGDCEDYAISKYFTLKSLNINIEKLFLVQVLYKNDYHLVLAFKNKKNELLVLDNLSNKLISLKQRKDLKELYSVRPIDIKPKKVLTSINKKNLVNYKWLNLENRLK